MATLCYILSTHAILPNSSVLLQHCGNVTVYHADSLKAAIRDAVDGDTLFLSKGVYSGFTIDKKITIRGEGAGETKISYSNSPVIIAIPDSVTLENTLLEGLYITNIQITKSVNGLKIKQCQFNQLDIESTICLNDVFLDRCYCTGTLNLNCYTNYISSIPIKSLTAVNCLIYQLGIVRISDYSWVNTSADIQFINCNIKNIARPNGFKGSIINSIVGNCAPGGYAGTFYHCAFINSVVYDYRTTFSKECYLENSWIINDNFFATGNTSYTYCEYTTEEIIEKGYIGNDGTVVGMYGGATPYTLTLAVPEVKTSDVKLDAEKKVLNVNLTLTEK